MITRREFLKVSGLAGAGLLLPSWGMGEGNEIYSGLTKFVDPLPLPGTLKPAGTLNGATYYEIPMLEFRQQLHHELPQTTVWGYNGTYPGPTIEARRGEKVAVRWINDLPTTHLLPIDTNLHGAEPSKPAVRTVVHLHGGDVRPESDGFPEAWTTPGNHDLFHYPNRQQATTLWYHDHALGITRLNVYAGLAGYYLIHDDFEDSLNIPRGKFEIPLVIQDRNFNRQGKLLYPRPPWVPEFFGRIALVNGKVWPFLEVEPRKYRFRILNGSNARFYNLKLFEYDENARDILFNSAGPAFHQIGVDGGFLPATVVLNDPQNPNAPRLLLSPAERADVIVDFSAYAGKSLLLHSNAKTPFKGLESDAPDDVPLRKIMLFRVRNTSVNDTTEIPTTLRRQDVLDPRSAVRNRKLTLEELFLPGEETPHELLLNGLDWDDAGPKEKPRLGTTEVWSLINLTEDVHPIHLHQVQFQILDRRNFDIEKFQQSKKLVYTGPRLPADANELGRKDTVRANPGQVTRIITRFNSFAGIYVWHCHILEHEDNEMMRPYEILR